MLPCNLPYNRIPGRLVCDMVRRSEDSTWISNTNVISMCRLLQVTHLGMVCLPSAITPTPYSVNNMSHLLPLMTPRQTLNLSGPSLQPSTGIQPQFDNPPHRNDVAIPIIITCIVLSSVLFTVRLSSKVISGEFYLRDCELSCHPLLVDVHLPPFNFQGLTCTSSNRFSICAYNYHRVFRKPFSLSLISNLRRSSTGLTSTTAGA